MRKLLFLVSAFLTMFVSTVVLASSAGSGYTWVETKGQKFMIPNNYKYADFGIEGNSLVLADRYVLPEVCFVLETYDVDPEEAKTVDLESLNNTLTLEIAPVSGPIETLDIRGTTCYLSTSAYTDDDGTDYIIKCADFLISDDVEAHVFALTLIYPKEKDDSIWVTDFYKVLRTEPDSFLYSNYEFIDLDEAMAEAKKNADSSNSYQQRNTSSDSYDYSDAVTEMFKLFNNIYESTTD